MQKTKLIAINSTLAQSVISLQLAHLTPEGKTESKEKKEREKKQKFSLMKNKFLFAVQVLEFHQEGNYLTSAKWDVLGFVMQAGINPRSHL